MNSYKQKPFPEIAGESHRSLQSVVVTEKTEKLLRRWQEKLIEKKERVPELGLWRGTEAELGPKEMGLSHPEKGVPAR